MEAGRNKNDGKGGRRIEGMDEKAERRNKGRVNRGSKKEERK